MVRAASNVARVLLVIFLLSASCGPVWGRTDAIASSPDPSPSASRVVLRVGWTMDPDNLNPFVANRFTSGLILSLNYDVLVGFDPETLQPAKGAAASGLATDWTTSADGKTWTFTLRRTAAWQDGSGPVTAQDVAFTYAYISDNAMTSLSTYTQGIIRVIAVDDYTVRVVCDQPRADMLAAANAVPILPRHVWSKVKPDDAATTYPNTTPIVGSGPFQCVEFKKSGYVKMLANESYWRGAPRIDEVLFEYYTNRDSMAWDLEAGTIDACYQLSFEQLLKLRGSADITARGFVVNGYDNLVMNSYAGEGSLGNPVLRDWRFRQALQWAVDRDKIAKIIYQGVGKPGDTIIPPGFSANPDWHWTPPASAAYTFDLAKAGQLLDAAGYADTNGDGLRDYLGQPIRLRLWAMGEYPASRDEVRMTEAWLRQLGLKVDVATYPLGVMYDRIFNMKDGELAPDFDICQAGNYLGLDPGQNFAFFSTDQLGVWNDSGFSNAEFDRLSTEQSHTLDTARRKQIVDRMQQIVYEQSPYIVLAYFGDTEAWRNDWEGWVVSPPKIGSALFSVDSYLLVHPRAGGPVAARGGPSGFVWLLLVILVGAAAAVGAGVTRRRRRRLPEEG